MRKLTVDQFEKELCTDRFSVYLGTITRRKDNNGDISQSKEFVSLPLDNICRNLDAVYRANHDCTDKDDFLILGWLGEDRPTVIPIQEDAGWVSGYDEVTNEAIETMYTYTAEKISIGSIYKVIHSTKYNSSTYECEHIFIVPDC
jgi:hypothetical protein